VLKLFDQSFHEDSARPQPQSKHGLVSFLEPDAPVNCNFALLQAGHPRARARRKAAKKLHPNSLIAIAMILLITSPITPKTVFFQD
jgi:hypothetical protein